MMKKLFFAILFIFIFTSCLFASEVIGLKESEFNWASNRDVVDKYVDDNLTRTHTRQRFDQLKTKAKTDDLHEAIEDVEERINKRLKDGTLTEDKIKEYIDKIEDLEFEYFNRVAYYIACINEKLDGTGLAFSIDTVKNEFFVICNDCKKKLYPEYIALVSYDQLINDLGNRANNVDKSAIKSACYRIETAYNRLDTVDMRYLLNKIKSKGLNSNKISLNMEEMALSQALDCQEKINDFYGNSFYMLFDLAKKSINSLSTEKDIYSVKSELDTIKLIAEALNDYDELKEYLKSIDRSISKIENDLSDNQLNEIREITNLKNAFENLEKQLVNDYNSKGVIEAELKNINSILEKENCVVYLDTTSKYFSYDSILGVDWDEYYPYEKEMTIYLNKYGNELYGEFITKLKFMDRYNPDGLISKNINYNLIKTTFNNIIGLYKRFSNDFYKVSYMNSIAKGSGISIAQKPYVDVAKSEAQELIEEFFEGDSNTKGLEDYLREINNELEDINVKVVIKPEVFTNEYINILNKKINWIYPKTKQEKAKVEFETKTNTEKAKVSQKKVNEKKNKRTVSNTKKRQNNNNIDSSRKQTKKENKSKLDQQNKSKETVTKQKTSTNKAVKNANDKKRNDVNKKRNEDYNITLYFNNRKAKSLKEKMKDTLKKYYKDGNGNFDR